MNDEIAMADELERFQKDLLDSVLQMTAARRTSGLEELFSTADLGVRLEIRKVFSPGYLTK
ncbi:hypothetical protein N8H71_17050 [Pseudomonas koreensis]|uniref:hypothetical protein n=1 Tax=Pseudomonas koreensis TaxID=198620 RepID=UPI0021C77F16|nr:hypothetical protein [Pseudomonas koreensis]MCU0073304.1 hypothetical protein [Pseudomonas koreensis]